MARRRSNAVHPEAGSRPGLQVHEAASRVQALLRERARLARDAQKKQQQLRLLQQRLSREAERVTAQMAPLVERHGLLVAELTALFAELLIAGRLPKRARAHVAQLRRSLELQGALAPVTEDHELGPFDEVARPWDEAPPARSKPGRTGTAPAEVAGARQVGQEKPSLRDIFRNLVRAIHPDKAQHEADRVQRTEVMKQATRAYEEGDLARLIELESAWQTQLVDPATGDAEARCRELERVNRELLDQVRLLTRQLRDTKRDAHEAFGGAAPEQLIANASEELDELQALCELLRDFRDGRLDFAELKRRTSPGEDEIELLEALLLEELARQPVPGRRRSRKAR